METVSKCNGRSEKGSPLLRLPAEILSMIIQIHVANMRLLPSLTDEFIQNRVPLANAWDPTKPTETNIYVERDRSCNFARALDLRLVNKALKELVDPVVESAWFLQRTNGGNSPAYEEPRTRRLDLMVVKDIGLFPTWLTIPPRFTTEDWSGVVVHIRIIRPGSVKFPKAWVAAGQHKATEGDPDGAMRSRWSLLTVLYLFVAGRLSWAVDAVAAKAPQPRCFHATLLPKQSQILDFVQFDFVQQEYDANGEETTSLGTGGGGYLAHPPPPGHTPFARVLLTAPQCDEEDWEGPGDDEVGAASFKLYRDLLDTLEDMHYIHEHRLTMLPPPPKDPFIDSVVERYFCTATANYERSRYSIQNMQNEIILGLEGFWKPHVKYDVGETSKFRCCDRAMEGNAQGKKRGRGKKTHKRVARTGRGLTKTGKRVTKRLSRKAKKAM